MAFKVTIKKWHAVAAWTWDAGDDVCGICRMPFDGCPPEGKYPGDDSPVVWGMCGHAFHLQCIQKWLAAQNEQRCPICRRPWEFKLAEHQEQQDRLMQQQAQELLQQQLAQQQAAQQAAQQQQQQQQYQPNR